jgi:hypothetical protein
VEVIEMKSWQQHAYGYREVAFAILVFGIYLHVSRLVFGADLVQRHLLLPRVDEVFGGTMAYAAVAGVAGWKALRFRGIWHRRMSKFITGFIMVSAPIHLATFFRASPARLGVLPWWYSFVEGALLYPIFASAVWRLPCAADAPINKLQQRAG